MSRKQWFTLVEIAPLEDFLRLTPEQRLELNNAVVNRLQLLEEFMSKLEYSWNFIKSRYGYFS